MVYRAERAKRLARLLAETPDSTDALAALVAADRLTDALRTARRIVETKPDRIATVIELLSKHDYRFRQDAAQKRRAASVTAVSSPRKMRAVRRASVTERAASRGARASPVARGTGRPSSSPPVRSETPVSSASRS